MKILKESLDERKKEVHQESSSFLDILIEDLMEERPVMAEKVALDLIFFLLFVSFETTSSGIMVILSFLTDNPEALQELTVSKNSSVFFTMILFIYQFPARVETMS